ncbi:MAG TPA: fibronectin type III domain-containing protein, partial [Gemmatimonadales bacterium]|nr:fibronectin type III domain-containing protein [Gemmatimonadales bacterium]
APWTVIVNLPANTTSYHDATLSPDVAYSYFVRAKRDGGTSGASNVVPALIVTAAPAAPGSVDAVPNGSNAAAVFWQSSSSNESGYRIERSTDDGATWSDAGSAGRGETSFFDFGGLVSEQAVCYRVVAFNQIGESPASSADCTTPPAGPTDLTATLLADGTVGLTWTDNSSVEDGYQVWVDDGYGDVFVIASLDANVTSFIDAGCYGCYYYSVVAIKDGGYSDFSDWVFPTSPAGVSGMRVRPAAPTSAPKPALRPQHGKGMPR